MGKIKKITIHAGHNPAGKVACGASDYIDESTEARIVVKKVVKKLKEQGIEVVDCTVDNGSSQSDVLKKICAKCNAQQGVDVNLSIHFNAATHAKKDGKTTGCEVWVRSASGIRGDLGKRICNQLSKIGFRDRGVKTSEGLYFLNHTLAPAILIEVCFVTDPDDANLYKAHKDDVADAIVKAIKNYNK